MHDHIIMFTFVAAASLGVVLLLISIRTGISAIILFLSGGILVGPYGLNLLDPKVLGDGLNTIVSLSVALILFEGGLTLNIRDYKQVSREVIGLLTKGVLVTWVGTAIAIHFIFSYEWAFSFAAASLVIVTGPTVIGPLLHRIGVRKKIHNILYWEGVLIDPIGVFIALLCYEWIVSSGSPSAFLNFVSRFLLGSVWGVGFGMLLHFILKREWVFKENINIFVLSMALVNFSIADFFLKETGLLSVTISGLVLGYKGSPYLRRLVEYKAELKDFLIGLLFILLAANLNLKGFLEFGPSLLLLLGIVILIIRPLNIAVSTYKSNLHIKEKIFLSWISPRGIVAASMASLFAINLARHGSLHAPFLEAFTYSVIILTILLQGFSAKSLGNFLGLLEIQPRGWLIIGGGSFVRILAQKMQQNQIPVVILDKNMADIKAARKLGLTAMYEDALTINPEKYLELSGIGTVLAVTENEELNKILCQRWHQIDKKTTLYYWESSETVHDSEPDMQPGIPIWAGINMKFMKSMASVNPNAIISHDLSISGNDTLAFTDNNKQFLQNAISEDQEPVLAIFASEDDKWRPWEAVAPKEDILLAKSKARKQEKVIVWTVKKSKAKSTLPVQPHWILFSKEENLFQLYDDMLQLVVPDYPDLQHKKMLEDFIAREKEFSSLLGHKIAIPHCYSEVLSKPIVIVARVLPQILCPLTNAEIELIFMVISPKNKPVEHLNMLSMLAHLISDTPKRQKMMQAQSEQEMYEIMIDF